MCSLPHHLYRAEQVRLLDFIASQDFGIAASELMRRAGQAAFDAMRRRWPEARRVAVFCGSGNNGGDGYVLARLARESGLSVCVYATAAPDQLKGAAAEACQTALAVGVPVQGLPEGALDADLIVDAVLGTGTGGDVRGAARTAIELMLTSSLPVFALDLPSGLDPDTGRVLGAAVRADASMSFIGLKIGLFTGQGPDCAGAVLFDDLGVPAAIYARVPPGALRLGREAIDTLGVRPRTAHKGRFGHVLVVGGESGMAGAARMAGEACLRVGAGLVSLATRSAHAAATAAARPELMVHGVEQAEGLLPLLDRATVIAAGCGLGRGEWGRALLGKLFEFLDRPLVLDADALSLLAEDPVRCDRWVLTPHPGEAARLLGGTAAEIQADRLGAAAALQASFGGTVVLKGAGTIVLGPGGPPEICVLGNPGMATGGMGDVLTGVIAGLIAQGLPPPRAAAVGVCLHAAAADEAARDGERGLLASDLMPQLRRLANP